MFINGKYTPFSDAPFSDTPLFETPVSKKHPLVDTTNEGKAAKKRKVQATPSKSLNNSVFTQNSIYNKIIHTCSEKQKAGGKENKKKEKPKGFILAVTSEPECKESLPPATSSECTDSTTVAISPCPGSSLVKPPEPSVAATAAVEPDKSSQGAHQLSGTNTVCACM